MTLRSMGIFFVAATTGAAGVSANAGGAPSQAMPTGVPAVKPFPLATTSVPIAPKLDGQVMHGRTAKVALAPAELVVAPTLPLHSGRPVPPGTTKVALKLPTASVSGDAGLVATGAPFQVTLTVPAAS